MMGTALPLILGFVLLGQEVDPSGLDEKQAAARLEPFFQRQAAGYAFTLDERGREPLAFVERPVLKWTADGNSGAVWVWTRDGRPEVVGCLGAFINGAGKLEGFHEFHSLTLKPLPRMEVGGVRRWESSKPGVTLRMIESAPEPAATDKLRLLQMRNVAREFTAQMKSGTQTHTLRLTPTPLYRYVESASEVYDGALFSYLWDNGTDPEVILMIEARRGPDGVKYHYAPIRFTWRECWMNRGDEEVWRVPVHREFHSSRVLRDHYVTCATGEIDLAALTKEEAAP